MGRTIALVLVAAVLSASQPAPAAPYADVTINDVPHVKQKADFCGEACAEMYLRKLGSAIDQDYVFDLSGVSPLDARGCCTKDLDKALKGIGFKTGSVWYNIPAADAAQLEAQWKALHDDLRGGVPSIVCMRAGDPPASEHFRLVLGYKAAGDAVVYHEPAEENGAYRQMPRKDFLAAWPLKYDARQWTIIRLRLQADRIRKAEPAAGFTPADYAQHMMELKPKLRTGFNVVIQPPFVVIGDEPAATVAARAKQTVGWAVEMLRKDYFAKDPDEILDVWLFKDKASYDRNTKEIFNDEPTTPFGYYSYQHHALIMNIGTGGGTLVHEIVHPFMRANFPKCPAWLNEGMGSLYEQSSSRGGHIRGLTNWRLAGLQEAIRDKRVPSFKELAAMDDDAFYRKDKGTNYAQARYLCYYLQEAGLLVNYYHLFVKSQDEDPTGYATLTRVLDEKDMDAFKKKWEAFVLKLTFP